MGNVKGYIKFNGKKATTRPLDGEEGQILQWLQTESSYSKEYFKYNGLKYILITNTETNNKSLT